MKRYSVAFRIRMALYCTFLILSLTVLAARLGAFEPALAWYYRAAPNSPTVVFIVLDTVRADRLSLCGYERPTSPTLERLVGEGASWTCHAVAPGSWTLPSHASFFTGLDVPAHGTHFSDEGEKIRGLVIRPLAHSFSTLAEQMAAAGYQTAGVSGNPVLVPASGLAQGFDSWRVAPAFGGWTGEVLAGQVREALRGLERDGKPLFLFVNIVDAHDPWLPVPAGLDWLPERPAGLAYFVSKEPGEWEAYVTGEMEDSEVEQFRARLRDLYDYGVYRADRTLGRILEEIRRHGWAEAGMRLVVVSDHGEFLGEHGLARHGRYLWEPNNRVPLLVLDTERRVELPTPVSALHAFSLVRDGALPETLLHPHAVAFPDSLWLTRSRGRVGGSISAALWSGSEKLLWMDGETARYDLESDPEELNPLAADGSPLIAELEALVDRMRSSVRRGGALSDELIEALRAAGYVQ
ncbi:MAG: sulfatase [Myxococcota bacterium]